VGRRFHYRGRDWIVLELLLEENRIVLTPAESRRMAGGPIQTNQYGQPLRRCPDCLTLPISPISGEGYSGEMLELLAGRVREGAD